MKKAFPALLFLLLCPPLVHAGEGRVRRSPNAIKDRYIVVFEDSVGREEVRALAAEIGRAHGANVLRVWRSALNGFYAEMPAARAEALSRHPRVKFVQEDAEIALSGRMATNVDPATTCDPNVSTCASTGDVNRMWALDRIDQNSPVSANKFGYCSTGAGVYIYVVDTGVKANHSEFWLSENQPNTTRVTAGYNATGDGFPANDPCGRWGATAAEIYNSGHGTAVASVAAGRKVGVAKSAIVVPVKVIGCGTGGTDAMLTDGVDWILRVPSEEPGGNPEAYRDGEGNVRLLHPAVVTFSTYRHIGADPASVPAFEQAIDALDAANIAVFASANNQNDDACNTTPGRHSRSNPTAAYRGKVITVGGSMIKNSPQPVPLFRETYDPSQPAVDARWICHETDDIITHNENGQQVACSGGSLPQPPNYNGYYNYMKGSNWGQCVTLFAPARNIASALMESDHAYRTGLGYATGNRTHSTGTSFSSPMVAGATACYLEQNPTQTPFGIWIALTTNTLLSNPGVLEESTLGFGSPNQFLRLHHMFVADPASTGVNVSGDAVFTTSAIGQGTLAYQWYRVTNPSFVAYEMPTRGWPTSSPVAGATGTTLTVHPTQKETYWVRITDDCGEADSAVATANPRPAPPSNMVATASPFGTTVDLSWTTSSNADYYQVYRKTSAAGNWTYSGSTAGPPATLTATTNQTYLIRAVAVAGDARTVNPSQSAPSNHDLAVTIPLTDVPIVAGSTVVKATHVAEIRSAVNSMCDFLGVSRFYDPATLYTSLVGQVVYAADWSALATQINSLRTNDGIGVGPFNFRDVVAPGKIIQKIHIDDLRNAVK